MTTLNTSPRSDTGPRTGIAHPPIILPAPPIPPAPRGAARPALSVREVEVLLAWLGTLSKEEAATELSISPATVGTHILRIRAKYKDAGRPAPSKAHLLARAIQDGYTTLDRW